MPQIITVTLAGIPDRSALEQAIRGFHTQRPSFTSLRLEMVAGRTIGRFTAETSEHPTSLLDALEDHFVLPHMPKCATPVMWPAPTADKLGPDAVEFVYPPPPTRPAQKAGA